MRIPVSRRERETGSRANTGIQIPAKLMENRDWKERVPETAPVTVMTMTWGKKTIQE
jgi:hypothetical protein